MNDIGVLELMIKHYEERGGGYSQKEALRAGIEAIKENARLKAQLDNLPGVEEIEKIVKKAINEYNRLFPALTLTTEILYEFIARTVNQAIYSRLHREKNGK